MKQIFFNKIKTKLTKNEFYANIATLISGSIISQAIPILISPILSRIYTPDDFSLLALYLSITNIFSVIASGRYDLAIMVADRNEEAINILALSLVISVFTTLVLIPISLIFNDFISRILKNDELSKWLIVAVLGILLTTANQNLFYWNNRNKNFKVVAINRVVQSGTSGFFQIIFGYLIKTVSGGFIIIGQFLGSLVAVLKLIINFIKYDRINIKYVSLSKIKEMAKKYSEFPKKTILSSLLNIFSNNGRYLILSFFLDKASLGSLFFSLRILLLPVSVIGNNIADVTYQKVVELRKKGVNRNYIKKMINKIVFHLSLVIIIPIIVLAIFGKQIFSFLFGSNYILAGTYSSILSFSLLFQFIFSPFCKVFYAYEKNNIYLLWEILRVIIFFIPIFILGIAKAPSIYIIISISISIIINYTILFIFLQGILNEKDN